MALRIVTADERLSAAANKTTLALFGPSGVGKTTLLRGAARGQTLCIDLEAGMKSMQDWRGDSIPVRCFEDAVDIACLVGGPNPAADPNGFFSEAHHATSPRPYPDLVRLLAAKSFVFLDSITDLTRQAMAWAKKQPEAFSREDRQARHPRRLRFAGARGDRAAQAPAARAGQDGDPGRDPGEASPTSSGKVGWQPQMEGGKAARELPGIVDQVITLALFSPRRRRRAAARSAARHGAPARLPGRQPLRPARQGPLRPPRRDRAARPRRPAPQDQRRPPPAKDEPDVRHERRRAAARLRPDPGRHLRQGRHGHPPRRDRRPGRGGPRPAQGGRRPRAATSACWTASSPSPPARTRGASSGRCSRSPAAKWTSTASPSAGRSPRGPSGR